MNQQCKRYLSMLAPQSQLGHCDYCGYWLGELLEGITGRVPSEDELKWQKWVIGVVGELLAAAPVLSKSPRCEIFAKAVTAQLSITFNGNISALARKLQLSRRTIRDWANEAQVPQLDSLLRFCHLFRIPPLRLFESEAIDVDCVRNSATVSLELKHKIKKHYRKFHTEQIRSALETELLTENDLPQPMSVVAKRLNYDQSFLYKHFPDLCRAISVRFQAYRKKQREERKQRILDEVRQTTFRVYKQGLYPSQERVRLLLAKPGSIKEPGALAVWHEALAELGLESKVP